MVFCSYVFTLISFPKKILCLMFHWRSGAKKWVRGFVIVVVVQSLSRVQLFVTPWIAACQASLSFTISQSLLQLMSVESVMPSNHLILCLPLLTLPSIFPSIRVFSSESAVHIKWPKYWSFSFSISPSNEGLISFRINSFDLLAVQGVSRVFSSTTVWRHIEYWRPYYLS